MDTALLNMVRSGRNKNWAETMVNLEARKLINTANTLSALHLRNGLTRMNFVQEIKGVVEQQFAAARRAKSDEECIACIKNLRAETENLEEQGRMLRTKAAKLYAKVEFIRENNQIVGYVISAVRIVLAGITVVGGVMMLSIMTPVGILAGATLIVDGLNEVSKETFNLLSKGQSKSQGIVANQVMNVAHFMGFKPESGLAFYNATALSASVYSIAGLTRRPAAWQLFRWLPQDYYRQITTMSRPKLGMTIVGYGLKAKVIFELLSTDNRSH